MGIFAGYTTRVGLTEIMVSDTSARPDEALTQGRKSATALQNNTARKD